MLPLISLHWVGEAVGCWLGCNDGDNVVGLNVGCSVGDAVVGDCVGDSVGKDNVGGSVGARVGSELEGVSLGGDVGATVQLVHVNKQFDLKRWCDRGGLSHQPLWKPLWQYSRPRTSAKLAFKTISAHHVGDVVGCAEGKCVGSG